MGVPSEVSPKIPEEVFSRILSNHQIDKLEEVLGKFRKEILKISSF